jgi:hypothetical protein
VIVLAAAAYAGDVELGKKVQALELATVVGAITVREDPAADRIRLVPTDRVDNAMCDLVVDEEKSSAKVTFGPKSSAQHEKCAMDFEVVLRPGAKAAVVSADGPITVRGTTGEVWVYASAGDVLVAGTGGTVTVAATKGEVRLDGAGGTLTATLADGSLRGTASAAITAHVDAGVIELDGLAAPVDLTTLRGRILLAYASAPTGEISVHAANGDVAIDLPAATRVRCLVTSTAGTAACEVPSADDAPLTVHAIADGGSVRVY